ncbi:sulfate/molybdate ABC transporter ATP-binding protein [Pseudarthrobacter sp. NPDC058362]|uniref:sulfate/molybdate ABC transporter ATP-binding protein n=1 Tax=Pseudarthrobacter sp. NPDC058362 TaxID=3346458 RepID=UPI00366399C0
MTFRVEAAVAGRGLDVALRVGAAETVAVMGPNGAGKSTLLDVIAGLLQPEHGEAELNGRSLFHTADGTWLPPHQRGTALLAQEPLLFPHLSVVDNVAFGPRSAGLARSAAREQAMRWLAEVEAADLVERRPAELSGGQAQRVAIARALAADPALLLLDEPMAALDVQSAPLLRRLLKRVLADRPAIIITHDALDALMLADRVVVLEGGRIVEEGPTREVLERPRSAFAAGLAGLNFVPGTLRGDGVLAGDLTIHGPGDGLAHQDRKRAELKHPELQPDRPGVAVFPPSSVSVYLTDAHGSPRNSFPVTITDLEPHGDGIRVRGGGLAADITTAASADLGLAPGMRVYFVVKASAVAIYAA